MTLSRQPCDNDMLLNGEQTAVFSVGFFGSLLKGDIPQPGKEKKNSPGLQARSNLLDSCHASSDTELMHLLKGGFAAAAVINGSLSQCSQLHCACTDRKLHSSIFFFFANSVVDHQAIK